MNMNYPDDIKVPAVGDIAPNGVVLAKVYEADPDEIGPRAVDVEAVYAAAVDHKVLAVSMRTMCESGGDKAGTWYVAACATREELTVAHMDPNAEQIRFAADDVEISARTNRADPDAVANTVATIAQQVICCRSVQDKELTQSPAQTHNVTVER